MNYFKFVKVNKLQCFQNFNITKKRVVGTCFSTPCNQPKVNTLQAGNQHKKFYQKKRMFHFNSFEAP